MISVAQTVTEIVRNSPFLEDGLQRGIISYSALARDIKKEVEEKTFKKVTVGSIVMALKRLDSNLVRTKKLAKLSPVLEHMTMRSNLIEITYLNSPTITNNYQKLFSLTVKRKDLFCSISQGLKEITLIISADVESEVKKIFKGEIFISRLDGLSAITMSLPKYIVTTPGAYYTILKKLSWENINVVEVLSTYTEFTIILATKDVERGFSILRSR
jgi:hypothetical protein